MLILWSLSLGDFFQKHVGFDNSFFCLFQVNQLQFAQILWVSLFFFLLQGRNLYVSAMPMFVTIGRHDHAEFLWLRLHKLILSIGSDPSPIRPNIIWGKGLASVTKVTYVHYSYSGSFSLHILFVIFQFDYDCQCHHYHEFAFLLRVTCLV